MGGAVISQSPAVKAYNGVDMLTIIKTQNSKSANQTRNNERNTTYNYKNNSRCTKVILYRGSLLFFDNSRCSLSVYNETTVSNTAIS